MATTAARLMSEQGAGVILSLTSGAAKGAHPGMGGTGPADAAIETFLRYLAAEAGPQGVRVPIYTAGVVETLTRAKIQEVSSEGPDPAEAVRMIAGSRLLQGFIDTHERGDAAAAAAMVADDIRITMPPHPFLFEGREAMASLLERAFGPESPGDWLLVPTRANRQPTAASYLRQPGDSEYRAFKFDVLRVEGGVIAEVTTFDASLFDAFGLPPTWPLERSS